jgi:hypothetical protein
MEVQATPTDEIILEEYRRFYDSLWSRAQAVNTKAGFLLAYDGVVVLWLLDSATSTSMWGTFLHSSWWIQSLVVFAGILFTGGILLSMRTLISQPFIYPGPSAVHDALFKMGKPSFHYLNDRKQVSRTEFIEQFIDGYAEVVRKSIPGLEKKSLYYKIALGLTVGFSLLLLLIAVLVVSL